MPRIWKTLAAVSTLALALTVWGCEQATEVTDLSPQVEVEGRDALLSGSDDIAGLTAVVSTLADAAVETVTSTIGASGGILQLGDHVLTVPPGAVSDPTTFTMRTVPNGGVEVELEATSRPSLLGFLTRQVTTNDVGSSGFDPPVRLALSYANTNAGDPEDLVIVRVDDGEPQETHVSADGTSTVWAELDHFSRYRLCSN